ncbi:MAG TPA: DUF3800 domain-containing protein [Candidatus Tripitaka californicus]|uniref:DUF3800 domain-containing protein n=1 Tax=Candidatus Tripitaka californicus TaxID=3367616 RepID=UPI0040255F7A|nr:DUF3800 domain-containing protein [Planctomycetota bacterium]
MLVFVDESGDAGLKLKGGSSKYFVIALIVFEENEEAEALDKRIDLFKRELRLGPTSEIKFNGCNKDTRKQFLLAVLPYNFFYLAIIINKQRLYGEGFKFKESFYKYASSLVFQNAKPYLHKATVVIDISGSKDFRRQLGGYLRRKINGGYIKKIKLQDSACNNLLQLADMVAGSILRSLSGKPDAREYRGIIRPRELHVQVWPK